MGVEVEVEVKCTATGREKRRRTGENVGASCSTVNTEKPSICLRLVVDVEVGFRCCAKIFNSSGGHLIH